MKLHSDYISQNTHDYFMRESYSYVTLMATLRPVVYWFVYCLSNAIDKLSSVYQIVKPAQYVLILIFASNYYSGLECIWRNGRLKAWQQRCNKFNTGISFSFLSYPYACAHMAGRYCCWLLGDSILYAVIYVLWGEDMPLAKSKIICFCNGQLSQTA